MNRPAWATVIGIIGIILGCFGILGGGQFMMMPKMMEMQKEMQDEMFTAMQKAAEKQGTANAQEAPPKEVFEFMERMWETPEWFGTYCVVAGIVGVCVAGFYIFASIRLLQAKSTAIGLFYSAIGLAIAFAILKTVMAMATMSFVGMSMAMGGIFGLVINVVLLIVVITGDKEAFVAQGSQQGLPPLGTYYPESERRL
jgi:hypothetical protein